MQPRLSRIMEITRLDMRLLNLIKRTTGMVAAEFNQNQLTQLVKLNMMNVSILMHVPNPYQRIGEVKLQEVSLVLLSAPHAAGQPEYGPVAEIEEIYNRLENARALARQHELDQNLVPQINDLIIQFRGRHQVPNPLLPPGFNIHPNRPNNNYQHILEFGSLLTPTQYSNLMLVNHVNENLKEMDRVLRQLNERASNQLAEITRNLISEVQDRSNWMQLIASDAAIKIEPYIQRMESLNDISNQVAAMYGHSPTTIPPRGGEIDQGYTWCGSFHKDIFNGDSDAVERFLQTNPLALTTRITMDGNTALHVAVKAEQPEIVQKLLQRLRQQERLDETLKKRNKEGKMALYIAASSGDETIAEKLVENNEIILLTECEEGTNRMLPLFVAAKYGNKKVVASFYEKMMPDGENPRPGDDERVQCFPIENPTDERAKALTRQWTLLLVNLIYNDDYDNASKIIGRFPHLALNKYTGVETPLFALAQRPSLGANVTFHDKASKFSCPTFIRVNKMDDGTTSKASELLEEIILTIKDWESHKPALSAAFFKAAEVGSVRFVAEFIKSHRAVLNWLNDLHQNIFHVAIINRQENIFSLIYGLKGSEKNDLTGTADNKNNWMLHLAGNLAPAYRLNQVPGPAMQLQRELQWFQVVKDIVPNISTDVKNLVENKTPHELFAKGHENLMKEGVDWMRNTASQCSIVAALITTVMFAAAFTLPGGNDQTTGDPLFLRDTYFLLFAAADLIALSTSCTSVLIFLSILTSRFAQEDFLISLPMRLIWGLVLLFVSMAAMTFAFCDTIYIIVHKKYHLFSIPVIVLVGLIPVFTFSRMMFPLLIILWKGRKFSIFDKSSRHMYY